MEANCGQNRKGLKATGNGWGWLSECFPLTSFITLNTVWQTCRELSAAATDELLENIAQRNKITGLTKTFFRFSKMFYFRRWTVTWGTKSLLQTSGSRTMEVSYNDLSWKYVTYHISTQKIWQMLKYLFIIHTYAFYIM